MDFVSNLDCMAKILMRKNFDGNCPLCDQKMKEITSLLSECSTCHVAYDKYPSKNKFIIGHGRLTIYADRIETESQQILDLFKRIVKEKPEMVQSNPNFVLATAESIGITEQELLALR